MSDKFHVSIESPQSGWVSLSLAAGERRFVCAMSHAPYDSLRELVAGLAAVVAGEGRVTVRWNREPEEYDFCFESAGGEVDFRVVRFRDHRRLPEHSGEVFAFKAAKAEFVLPFWRELRQLRRRSETDVFEQNWRRPFPHEEFRRLNRAVKELRRAHAAPPPSGQI